ncbi:MAG: carbohydrate kinase family protein [Acidimicrobiales bacterium]
MRSTDPSLVFVGVATHDTIALVDRYPELDERIVASELVQAGGGPAATAAVAAARLGHSVAFIGTLGQDEEAASILAGLTAEGVDVSGVSHDPVGHSAASLVIVSSRQSTRTIINRPPPAIQMSNRAIELLTKADWIHVDQGGWAPAHDWWVQQSERPRFSVDAGNPIDGFDPNGLDLYGPTIGALRTRYGDLDYQDLLGRAVEDGARLVVATDGGNGSFALGTDQPLISAEAVTGPILSTLGAGDVFHGALLAAIQHDLPISDCLRYANLVAYRSCQGLDGRSAIPTHRETLVALGAT